MSDKTNEFLKALEEEETTEMITDLMAQLTLHMCENGIVPLVILGVNRKENMPTAMPCMPGMSMEKVKHLIKRANEMDMIEG